MWRLYTRDWPRGIMTCLICNGQLTHGQSAVERHARRWTSKSLRLRWRSGERWMVMVEPITLRLPAAPCPDRPSPVIRPARVGDVPRISRLINGYATQGLMLPKTDAQLYNNVRD